MIVTSALIIWKALMCVTGSESPVVVVLSGSMEPGFKRVCQSNVWMLQHFLIKIGSSWICFWCVLESQVWNYCLIHKSTSACIHENCTPFQIHMKRREDISLLSLFPSLGEQWLILSFSKYSQEVVSMVKVQWRRNQLYLCLQWIVF